MHPHAKCPVCKEEKQIPETIDGEYEALVESMRTSAQETLYSLHRHGFRIIKADR